MIWFGLCVSLEGWGGGLALVEVSVIVAERSKTG